MDNFPPFNPVPWLVIVALCLALASTIARHSAFYRARLDEEESGRYGHIDGLRGFLALAVFGAHAMNMYFLAAHGQWDRPIPTFYSAAAEAGVSLFFMITAFLFWSRVIRQGPSFDARGFLEGRVRRLVPMYLASVVLAVLVIVAASGTFMPAGPATFVKELRSWLSFGFMTTGDLNGLADARTVNAVYWTLAYEWMFYLVLPLAALYARGWRALGLVAVMLVFGKQSPIVLNFLFGALGAELVQRRVLRGALASPWLAPVPLLLLGVAVGGRFETVYGVLPEALLFGFFVFVLDGNSLGGLLRSRPSRMLGLVSYSVYLTHCILVYVAVHVVHAVVGMQNLDAMQYWSLAALAAAATVLLSAATYRFIEYPFIARKPLVLPAHGAAPRAFTPAAENGVTTLPSASITPTPLP